MSPDPFDAVDRALVSGLSALAPEVGDGDEMLASMRPRFERARTRARLVKIGGTVGALVVIGSLVTLIAPSSSRTRVSVSSQTSPPATAGRPVRSSTTSTSATTVPPMHAGSAATVVSSPTTAPHPSSTTAPTVIVPITGPGDRSPGHGSHSTTTTVPSGDVREYGSPSGSITVRFRNGALALLHVAPGPGIAGEVHDRGPDRVEVRFTSGGAEKARIEIRVENGIPVRIDHSEG